jgi:hypothetical protein
MMVIQGPLMEEKTPNYPEVAKKSILFTNLPQNFSSLLHRIHILDIPIKFLFAKGMYRC